MHKRLTATGRERRICDNIVPTVGRQQDRMRRALVMLNNLRIIRDNGHFEQWRYKSFDAWCAAYAPEFTMDEINEMLRQAESDILDESYVGRLLSPNRKQ